MPAQRDLFIDHEDHIASERELEFHIAEAFRRAGYSGSKLKAVAKANRLLKKFLTPDQFAEYKLTGHFTVVNGKRKYVLGNDLQVRVYDIDDYQFAPAAETWCVRLPGTPFSDSLVAQLLLLRSHPGKLRKMACVTSGRRRSDQTRVRDLIRRAGYRI